MKASELRKIIQEEVKKTLTEDKTFPIGLEEILTMDDDIIIVIGNSSADLIGYKPEPDQLKKLDDIMRKYDFVPYKKPVGGMFSAGKIKYRLLGGGATYMSHLLDIYKQVKALKLSHSY